VNLQNVVYAARDKFVTYGNCDRLMNLLLTSSQVADDEVDDEESEDRDRA
jgi:hypothetical protein